MKTNLWKEKKGITLISLVVTIIVLLILAGVGISLLSGENGLLEKTKGAKETYEKTKANELTTLGELEDYIYAETGKVILNEAISGEAGTLKLDSSTILNCSNTYSLKVESDKYNGEIPLKIYGLKNEDTGVMEYVAYSSTNASHKLRELYNPNTYNFDENTVAIKYIKEEGNEEATITYNSDIFGEEFAITSITEYKKKYDGFAKIAYKVSNNEEITTDDILEMVQYCLNQDKLGYEYVGGEADQLIEQEKKERQLLQDIVNNKRETVEAVKQCLSDQILYMFIVLEQQNFAGIEEGGDYKCLQDLKDLMKKANPYTLADYYVENTYLNEFKTRLIGQSIVPLTILYLDEILVDLNQNGKLENPEETAEEGMYSCLAGVMDGTYLMTFTPYNNNGENLYFGALMRGLADYYATFESFLDKKGQTEYFYELVSSKQQAYEMEEAEVGVMSYGTYVSEMYWKSILEYYFTYEMDTMYKLMYDNGIEINVAGLSMGYNAIFAPQWSKVLNQAFSREDSYTYDIKEDTKYIEQQGAAGIIDQLDEYVTKVQDSLK